ncbi:DUF1501 domain-containing protein [Blastopirellula sp. J2-11]|uniref:DUF1501 domain-containing protein n=1 Tax=Blastopirellula sp. J2-11 TaxID=2943192 RepID=UPI0021C59BCB|nr:DUF1501 domain-containing protein [Blastopirellula sp. J2-11]UUO04400.1 DUF1501 domain-containing protein [Blastopirellula sp. J2-11]
MPSNHTDSLNRREMLQRSGIGLGMLGLSSLVQSPADALASPAAAKSPLAVKNPHFPGRVKRVVHFFLNGGPSHVDTFDRKPMLQKYAGQTPPMSLATERKTGACMPSPFKFQRYGESGIEVSELFAKTAEHIDDIAVIRSMYAQVPNHEPSLMLMNCGDSVLPRPSVGSWTLYGLGTENQNLPGFIAMCPNGQPVSGAANWQSGFLPGSLQGTYIDSKHEQLDKLIENIRSRHATIEMQSRQLELLNQLNNEHRSQRHDPRLESRIHSFELAFRMQMEAADAFDINQETQETRQLYGESVHGRQTLIARRLLEHGVRYVQLWHDAGNAWDHHANLEPSHRKLSQQIDQPIAALMTDLKRRGMFEDTLIIWGGEFGRTPTVELNGSGATTLGRDHNHYGFTVWMAGGGVRGGTAYGATDDFGFKAVERPTSVHDLHATILHLLGFDHTRLTYRYAGRDFRLTDVHGHVLNDILS